MSAVVGPAVSPAVNPVVSPVTRSHLADNGGPLVITGPGSTMVATDAMVGFAQSLDRLSGETRETHLTLSMIAVSVSPGALRSANAVISAFDADAAIEQAREFLVAAHDRAGAIAHSLRAAATAYGETERAKQALAERLAGRAATAVGSLTPLLFAAALPALVFGAGVAGGVILGASLVPGGVDSLRSLLVGWVADHREILGDPSTVALIRLAVMSTDDYFGGLIQLPPGLVAALGDEGVGVTGVNTAAAAIIIGAAPLGLLSETGVGVTAVPTAGIPATGTVPPKGLVDRLDRIPGPEAEDGTARVRIDTIHTNGHPDRYEVFIAGTVSWDVVDSPTPFDLTSNLHGVAGLDPGSRRAVEAAMAASGITSESEVVFTGYSQGALIARAIAASGDYRTAGLVTFGGPGGQIELPGTFPTVIVEHTDDLVPALGGSEVARDAVHLGRQVYPGGFGDNPSPVPAHERSAYRETAALADGAVSDEVRRAVRALDAVSDGADSVTSVSYLATRVDG